MLTIEQTFEFLERTFVQPGLLRVLELKGTSEVPEDRFIYENFWERRFDMDALKSLWDDGHTFIVHSSNVSPEVRELVETLERRHLMAGQAHVYMGTGGSRSFPKHADNPENYIFQCVGQSEFTLFNETAPAAGLCDHLETSVDFQRVLNPGDEVFIPSRRIHFFQPLRERLSISVPLMPGTGSCQMT